MLRKLFATEKSSVLTVLRVTLGVVMFAHGAQKMLGWFAFRAGCAEFFGGLGLCAGLLTRVAALGVAGNMIVAVAMVEGHTGFFMNWEGQKQGEGYEYHLLVLAMTYALIMRGAGSVSVDRLLTRSRQLKAS